MDLQRLYAPVQGNARARKREWMGWGAGRGEGIAVSCEAMPVPGKYRNGCSQSSTGWNTGTPMEELEKVPKELKGSATL